MLCFQDYFRKCHTVKNWDPKNFQSQNSAEAHCAEQFYWNHDQFKALAKSCWNEMNFCPLKDWVHCCKYHNYVISFLEHHSLFSCSYMFTVLSKVSQTQFDDAPEQWPDYPK